MASTDTQLEQIIFNTLSQEKYDELKASGQINPNEIYLVPDTEEIPENVVQSDNYENAKLWKGTLAEYEALGTYDDSVTYIITDDNGEDLYYTKTEVDNLLDNVTVDLSDYAKTEDVNLALENKADKSSISDGKLTIQANGVEIATFTANQNNDILANIEIPKQAPDIQGGEYIDVNSENNTLTIDWNAKALSMFDNIDALPSQEGNNGKFLTTDGSVASWSEIPTQVSKLSELENDTGFVTSNEVYNKEEVNLALGNKADKETTYTKTEVDNLLSPKATTEYVDGQIDLVEKSITDNVNTINQALALKADKTEIPTKTSQLTNDSGYLTQHQDISGKADKSDTYTKAEVDAKVTSVYRFQGSVASESALPTTDLVVGDVYNVEDTGDNYAWTEEGWDKLAGTIDLTPYLTKTAASTTYATISAVNGEIETLEQSITNNVNTINGRIDTEVETLNGKIDLKANDSAVVHLSGNETIADVKTFSSSPIIPTIEDLTNSTQNAASTKFVQDVVNTNKTTITYWD